MSRASRDLRGALLLALAALAHPLAGQDPAGGCRSCHAPEGIAHAASAHGGTSVGCTECHGGDAAAGTREAAHAADFRGAIPRTAVPRLCAGCHADPRLMLPFGLRTDQFQHYAISGHGVAVLRKGDPRAAVCTDCHGTHRILPPADPSSPVHPRRLPETCARCHADAALMRSVGLADDVVPAFLEGAHGRALLGGVETAPTCASCHGIHASTPPGAATVPEVCGRCHEAERAAFRRSPHGTPSGEQQVRCDSCHNAHRTLELGVEDLQESCRSCHAGDAAALHVAATCARRLRAVGYTADRTLRLLAEASEDLAVAPRAAALQVEVAEGLAQARAATHSLDHEALARFEDRLRVVAEEAEELARHREELAADRRLLLVPIFILFAGLVAALLLVRAFVAGRRRTREGRS